MRDKRRRDPLPYYPWHVKDYRANRKVQRMSYVERGLYRELIDECWVEGAIPDDLAALAEICGCPFDAMADAWAKIRPCFVEHPDNPALLVNPRVEDVREVIEDKRAKASRAGQLSASKKGQPMSTSVQHPLTTVDDRQPIKEKESKEKETKELLTTTTSIRQKTDESPEGGKVPANWVGRLGDQWLTLVGHIPYGRIGKDLGPFVRIWGEAVVSHAITVFARQRKAKMERGLDGGNPDGWAQFLRDFTGYVPENAVPATRAAK